MILSVWLGLNVKKYFKKFHVHCFHVIEYLKEQLRDKWEPLSVLYFDRQIQLALKKKKIVEQNIYKNSIWMEKNLTFAVYVRKVIKPYQKWQYILGKILKNNQHPCCVSISLPDYFF